MYDTNPSLKGLFFTNAFLLVDDDWFEFWWSDDVVKEAEEVYGLKIELLDGPDDLAPLELEAHLVDTDPALYPLKIYPARIISAEERDDREVIFHKYEEEPLMEMSDGCEECENLARKTWDYFAPHYAKLIKEQENG